MVKIYYRLNQFIRASEVRVIDEQGKQVGVLPLSEALKRAQNVGLDLVEIAPNAKPPVTKIIDFKKFKFLEDKKEQDSKRKSKKVELKEVRLSPFMGSNDLNHRLKKTEDFLKDGNRVKLSVFFRGREITKKEFGERILATAQEKLKGIAEAEGTPKLIGRQMEILLTPIKSGSHDKTKNENQEVDQSTV